MNSSVSTFWHVTATNKAFFLYHMMLPKAAHIVQMEATSPLRLTAELWEEIGKEKAIVKGTLSEVRCSIGTRKKVLKINETKLNCLVYIQITMFGRKVMLLQPYLAFLSLFLPVLVFLYYWNIISSADCLNSLILFRPFVSLCPFGLWDPACPPSDCPSSWPGRPLSVLHPDPDSGGGRC